MTTHPGACDIVVCAEAAATQKAESRNAANVLAKKRANLRFSWGNDREKDALELVIFDTSSFQELPRQVAVSTRGMEDRLKSNRRCS
jgi:hypothetical protein